MNPSSLRRAGALLLGLTTLQATLQATVHPHPQFS